MSKILFIPSNTNIGKYNEYVDGYIFSLEDYSINFPFSISLDKIKEIDELCNQYNKELFISINKNIYSSEMDNLAFILKELDQLHIKGIMFADTALIQLKKELDLKVDLVWSQEHLTTNYQTINNWYEYGAKMAYISSDINLREINEIKDNTKAKLIVPIFGYIPVFTSFRHEIKNYLDNFRLNAKSSINYIEKENNTYPIIDTNEGTVVFSNKILNGYKEYKNLKVDYVTINSFNIEDKKIIDVLKTFKDKKLDDFEFENSDKGFLYKDMIYKIK